VGDQVLTAAGQKTHSNYSKNSFN